MTSKSGTLAYLAPEVYSGRGYDVRADWWSLGVTFYECIYNKVRLRQTRPRLFSEGVDSWLPSHTGCFTNITCD